MPGSEAYPYDRKAKESLFLLSCTSSFDAGKVRDQANEVKYKLRIPSLPDDFALPKEYEGSGGVYVFAGFESDGREKLSKKDFELVHGSRWELRRKGAVITTRLGPDSKEPEGAYQIGPDRGFVLRVSRLTLDSAANAQQLMYELETKGAKFGVGVAEALKDNLKPQEPMLERSEIPLLADFDLRLKMGTKTLLDVDWLQLYRHYSRLPRGGVLILAGKPEFFSLWAESKACRDEVAEVPSKRLFAYVGGYIVIVGTEKNAAMPSEQNTNCGYKIWANGDMYVGPIKDSKMHGEDAKYFCASGNRYEGPFKDDIKHGEDAKYFYTNDERYEGPFKDGKRHGEDAKYFYAGGDRYEGPYKDGKRHGEDAKFFYASGDRYEGPYKDDKKHGVGTYTFADGEQRKGEWHEGERTRWLTERIIKDLR